MAMTLVELLDKLKQLDEITVMEILDISTEDLLDRFVERVEERFEELEEDFDNDISN